MFSVISAAAAAADAGTGDLDLDRDLLLLSPVLRPRPLLLLLRLLLPLPPLLLLFEPCCFFCFTLRSHSETELLPLGFPFPSFLLALLEEDGVNSVLLAAEAAAGASALGFPSPSALSSSLLLARALFLPPPSIDAFSDEVAADGAKEAVEVSVPVPAPAVAVGLAVPHASHLRFLDELCRVHLEQAHSGPGPRRFCRLVPSSVAAGESADPAAAALVLVGEGAPLAVAAVLCLFLPPPLEADADRAIGSFFSLAVSARRLDDARAADDDRPPAPPAAVSCSLLAYAASLDVRWRTWRRPPLPLMYFGLVDSLVTRN